ncbi:MAG: glycine cleavage system aminomethyltransferase GcvT [Nitrososphaerales archaeon]
MVDLKVSPLHQYHVLNARLSEFSGYEMPIWYSSVSEEHMAVRAACGLFDISHMGRVLVEGNKATTHLDHLIPTDFSRLEVKRGLYSTLLDRNGGIVDDVVILRLAENRYFLVVNAINLDKDLKYLASNNIEYSSTITDVTMRTAMIAIQGPNAESLLQSALNLSLKNVRRFGFLTETVLGSEVIISRTGYTGEDGFEIIAYDGSHMIEIWNRLLSTGGFGLRACALGARDTLRLEAGFPLYGYELTQEITPVEAGLSWLISRDKVPYLGKQKITEQLDSGTSKMRVGIVMKERGIPRHGYMVESEGRALGSVTSGTYSPLLRTGIAMGYVDRRAAEVSKNVLIRMKDGKAKRAMVTRPPFYDSLKYGHKRTDSH